MTAPKERTDIQIRHELAVLAAVHLPTSRFDERDPLGELRALAETAGTRVVGEIVQRRDKPESATYMGKGKVEELKLLCDELEAEVVIFDHELSPKQIANVEEVVGRKVLDRSELILDIFASRATTAQAKLSVELAQLEYTYPRLRAMWSHLERIVGTGGIGGVGTRGPGEQQLEIDRRIVQQKKTRLKRELEAIHARKQREVAGRNREYFTVGLVGYTNAGKSTLFNALTAGGAHANDQLFATLMTRSREWDLGSGEKVMLSDTVGFVRDLPHHLIASFRSTLEEATHADVLIVVLDISDPSAELQLETVEGTLGEVFARVREQEADWKEPEVVLALNKVDLLRDNTELLVWQRKREGSVAVSSVDIEGGGVDALTERVRDLVCGGEREVVVRVALSDSKTVAALERHGEILDRAYEGADVVMRARIRERVLERILNGAVDAEVTSGLKGHLSEG